MTRAAARDVILDRWVAGDTARSIAADLRLPSQSVRNLIADARGEGDQRAVRRHAERSDKGKGRIAPDPLPCTRMGCVGLRHREACVVPECGKTYSVLLTAWQRQNRKKWGRGQTR